MTERLRLVVNDTKSKVVPWQERKSPEDILARSRDKHAARASESGLKKTHSLQKPTRLRVVLVFLWRQLWFSDYFSGSEFMAAVFESG